MEKVASDLNKVLKETSAYSMLSDYGRRMYVPKGIIVQGAEAKQKTMGTIRGHISNCSTNAQNIILKAMDDENHDSEKKEAFKILKSRYTAFSSVDQEDIGGFVKTLYKAAESLC